MLNKNIKKRRATRHLCCVWMHHFEINKNSISLRFEFHGATLAFQNLSWKYIIFMGVDLEIGTRMICEQNIFYYHFKALISCDSHDYSNLLTSMRFD